MSIKEDIEKVENKMKEIENESLAMEFVKDYKKANKRMFIIIIVILSMWFATIGAFIYYINTTGYYGEYGRGGSYGRRGVDSRYRGSDSIDRMAGEYGRYQENRERYGAGEETDKSFHYMVKSLEDFIQVLYEEAESPQQKQMLMETLQRSMK